MMTRGVWDELLSEARKVHEAHPPLQSFCPFPDDLRAQDVTPHHINAAALMAAETDLDSSEFAALRDAFVAAGPHATWRETYRDTDIGDDFMNRFGCYCLVGDGGAFGSDRMCAWVVYMPAGLWYPWHHHPGEEMYLTIAGHAEFMRAGEPNEHLGPGQFSQHASNQSHAMQTHLDPVMAYVVWRNGFETPPVLTPS